MTELHILHVAVRVVSSLPWSQPVNFPIFLYLGPETILPVASILASIIGVILMFWRLILGSIRRVFRRSSPVEQPEMPSQDDPALPIAQDKLPKP